MLSSRALGVLCRHHVSRVPAQQTLRTFTTTHQRQADFTHAVIGGGAVGLAIARRLQQVEGAQVVLIEKHPTVGTETSSRNSEVVSTLQAYGSHTDP